ncbi:hypothetical protein SZN_27561 [Streptomyces zinciresistens K42]|uniref:Secreted protein n=1 Tax=Streptomyces zinciresistens K42 TaxID=700597 RepID=G2GJ22_9ACTN|nr:hypothetical protein SZN_27561 [Streptomyces zinciresistens K42]
MIPFLTVVLLALQFFASPAAFAHAHTFSQAEAKAKRAFKPSGKASRETAPASHPRVPAGDGDPTGPLRGRARSADSGQAAAARPAPDREPSTGPVPSRPGGTPPRTSRPPTSHTPAALQVFRC